MSCHACDFSNQELPVPSLIYEGTQWRLEHKHPASTLGASALITKRRLQALHELNDHEWKELRWLLSNWIHVVRSLTGCQHESLASSPCSACGHLCFELTPQNGELKAKLPNEAIASFCLQAQRKFQAQIEDVHVLDVDDKLRLRSPQLGDAAVLKELIDENRSYLRKWLAWVDFNQTLEDSKAFIRATHEGRQLGTDFVFLIELQGKIVGTIAILKPRSSFPWGEMGYWISQEFSGQGLVTRCAERMLNYAFDILKLARVEIRVHPDNKSSVAVAERLGAAYEGVSHKGYLRSGGVLQDALVYSRISD